MPEFFKKEKRMALQELEAEVTVMEITLNDLIEIHSFRAIKDGTAFTFMHFSDGEIGRLRKDYFPGDYAKAHGAYPCGIPELDIRYRKLYDQISFFLHSE